MDTQLLETPLSKIVKSIYIAGPMSSIPDFNFPAFYAAADMLESIGWKVYNPAEKDAEADLDAKALETGDAALAVEKGFDFKAAYLWDIEHVIKADAIYMLKGWEISPGACGEYSVAVAMKRHYPEYEIFYE